MDSIPGHDSVFPVFRDSRYRVLLGRRPAELRVGETAAALERQLPGHSRFAILTACNPMARFSSPRHNRQRQQELALLLLRGGWRSWPAINGEGRWLEPSYLIADIGDAQLQRLARRFGQLASLCWHRGQPVTLRCHADAPVNRPAMDAAPPGP